MTRYLPSSIVVSSFTAIALIGGVAAKAAAQDVGTVAGSPDAVQTARASAATLPSADSTSSSSILPAVSAPGPERSVPYSFLLTGLKDDVRRLPSKFTVYSLGIGGALALAVHPADARLAGLDGEPSKYKEFFSAGQNAGSGWAQYGGAAATFLVAKLAGNYEAQVIGADLVRAQTLTAGIVYSIKGLAQRERPDGKAYSFPSGHAATTFATATVLYNRLGWKVGLPAFALAGYVATSRVPDRRHYASDIAFGSAIGLSVGQAVSGGSKRITVAPLLAPGMAGVQVGKSW